MRVSLCIFLLLFGLLVLAFSSEAQEEAPQKPPLAIQQSSPPVLLPQVLPSYVTKEELAASLKETKRDWKRDLDKTEEHMEHILDATTIILTVFGLILLVMSLFMFLFVVMSGGGLYYIYNQGKRISRQRKEVKGTMKQVKKQLTTLEELAQRVLLSLEKREPPPQPQPEE